MKLHSIIRGNQPQHLLILHGLFGQSDNWNTLGKKLGETFTTHLLDLRNHGRSPHADSMTHAEMAADIQEYLLAQGIEKAHLIGHSLGGKVAMNFALLYPQQTQKLLVADMAPKSYPPHHQGIIKGLQSVDFSVVEKRAQVEEQLQNYIPEWGVRQFLLKNVYRKPDNSYAFRFNLPVISREYEMLVTSQLPQNKTFEGEVLFLGGEKSAYILPEDEMQIKTIFLNAKIDYVTKAGHWLHAENPNEFMQKTLEFLN